MSKTAARDITIRRIRLEDDAPAAVKGLSPQANLARDSPNAKNANLKSKGSADKASQLKKILGRVKTTSKLGKEEISGLVKTPYYDM